MTLVSFSHKFIFLKTRKTAGTSVEMYLQPFCTPSDTPVEEWCEAIVSKQGIVGQRLGVEGRRLPPADPSLRDQWFSHQNAADLKRKLPWWAWRRSTKITVLRNPFRRVLSGFLWRNRKVLDDWSIERQIRQFRKSLRNDIISDDRSIVFIKGKFQPDIVLHAECLASELPALMSRLNLDPTRTTLPRTKVSKPKKNLPLSDWYDAEGESAVRKNLSWMFETGGYSLDLASELPLHVSAKPSLNAGDLR